MRATFIFCSLYLGSASIASTTSLSSTSLSSTSLSSSSSTTPTPPTLAESFSINFTETFAGFPAPPTSGAWFYDYPQKLWRADHHAPNSNNFCSCVTDALLNLSCSLIFSPGTGTGVAKPGLYVDFPEQPESCCFLCSDSTGCSPLIPAWLANSTYTGNTEDGCSEFCEQGAEAMDCMSFPPTGSMPPCKYMETFSMGAQGTIYHNLSFIRSTYLPGPPDSTLFALRPECSKTCPKTFPDQCGR